MHQSIGQQAAEMKFDRLITVGPFSRITAEAAQQNGLPSESYDTCREAAARLKRIVHSGDVVLIKGSHAMHMETISGILRGETE